MIRARILLAAIKARRWTSATLFGVAVVAVAAAAIGPMFLHSADTSVLTSTANAAPIGQTDVLVISNGGATKMAELASAASTARHLAGGLLSSPIFTADVGSDFATKHQPYEADILARSGICAHLRIVSGVCPTGINEVAISARSASTASVAVGARLSITEPRSSVTTDVTVTAIYEQPSTSNDAYWRGNDYFDYGTGVPPHVILDPFVASFSTALEMNRITAPQLSADIPWRASATLSGASALESDVATIKAKLFSQYDLAVSTGLTSVVDTAHHDDSLMSTVVLAIVLQLILLSLIILYTLGRSTILERRQESEFARRHGFPRSALIALAVGEPTALIIAAFPVGLLLAWGALALFAGSLFVAGTPVLLPGIAVACAAGACLAGVCAMTIASSDLWRSRASSRRQSWRVGAAVDAFAVALAVTGVVSLLTRGSLSGASAQPLALLAPGLLTLAAALVGLRLAGLLIQVFIARTGESSRVASFLALRQIGRRPAALRELLPLTAATAVLLFAVGSFFLASSNRALVANVDVGAARVVDVTPPPGLNFEAAVRRADPSGHEAMAAVYYSSSSGDLLAVDSSRLATVAFWPAALSTQSLASLARKLAPRVPPGVTFTGNELRLSLDIERGTPPIILGVNLFDQTFQSNEQQYFGHLSSGPHVVTVPLANDCPGVCRLTGLAPNWEDPSNTFSRNVRLVVQGIAVKSGNNWRNVDFGSGKRGTWSAQPSSVRVEPPANTCCSVAFDIPGRQLPFGGLLLSPVDLPRATPAIVTNGAEVTDAPPNPSPRGNLSVDIDNNLLTIHPLVSVPTLPLIGNGGAIVNLDYAERAFGSSAGDATFQVWLAPSANPTILQRLRKDGVAIGSISSASARLGVLDHGGIALAYAVALIVSPIAALLAIGTVMFVLVSDGRRRRREFASLGVS
ncbi:MAG TPA: FtsX-like permease family protein, partial [Acidimicrobiales bacterium]|nr:FtsX-like permease family protein [Acidimicrobiales bacterium]